MIISDLQHIETATETEVKGGKSYYNVAAAGASAEAFGKRTKAYTTTGTLVIEGEFSGSSSDSFSETY